MFLAMRRLEAFEVVLNHFTPEDPSAKSYEELTNILDKYYASTRNQMALTVKFRNRRKQRDEKIADYVLKTKKLSRYCGYGEHLEVKLWDIFVGRLVNPNSLTNLIQKKGKPNLEEDL